ncbi:hypothetical protein N9P82_00325 [bacterium]|nr:hypothetical protein [bacterium]
MLERTVRFLAFVVLRKKTASWHSLLVKLVKEPAAISFHAEPAQPVSANCLRFMQRVCGENSKASLRS